MYEGDSFHTLSVGGQVGLIILTTLLSVLTILLSQRLSKNQPWAIKLLIAIAAFWLFTWLSPQVYYAYYWFLFEGLPIQIVVKSPQSPKRVVAFALFQEAQTLSAHGKGILFWLLVFANTNPIGIYQTYLSSRLDKPET